MSSRNQEWYWGGASQTTSEARNTLLSLAWKLEATEELPVSGETFRSIKNVTALLSNQSWKDLIGLSYPSGNANLDYVLEVAAGCLLEQAGDELRSEMAPEVAGYNKAIAARRGGMMDR